MRTLLLVVVLGVLFTLGCAQTCEDDMIAQFTTSFDNPITRVVIANSAKNDIYLTTADGSIYRSTDSGETFSPIMSEMPQFYDTFGTDNSGVYSIVNAAEDGLVYFIGASAKIYWLTRGDGTYKEHLTGEDFIYHITPHPENGNLVLRGIITCRDPTDCYPILESSVSQGTEGTWSLVREYVFDFSWGTQQNQIFVISISDEEMEIVSEGSADIPTSQRQLMITYNFGSSFQSSPLGYYDFTFDGDVLYTTQYNEETSFSDLIISADSGTTFLSAEFNSRTETAHIDSQNFMIQDSTQGVSFISICNGIDDFASTLFQAYLSDAEYFEILDNLRGLCTGTTDFQRLHGLNGLYFANTYHSDAFLSNDTNIEEYIQSKITFDKGGNWQTLPVPDSSTCTGDCSLHLFSSVDYASVYSTSTAAGVLIALGNEGKYRLPSSEANTYLSRNAGYTWELLHEGAYSYTTASHGSLFVMAPLANSDSILYSWSQGETWESCALFEEEKEISFVENISNDDTNPTIVMLGSNTNQTEYYISFVSFADATPTVCEGFAQPGTEDSDYESFVPEAHGSCLLGQNISVTRRKRGAECLSTFSETHSVIASCECTPQDYSCAGNCWKAQETDDGTSICVNACVGEEGDPEAVPEDCEETYEKPSGYRLVQGDSCVGGVSLADPIIMDCPSGASPAPQPSTEPFPSVDYPNSNSVPVVTDITVDETTSGDISYGLIIGGISVFLIFIFFVCCLGVVFLYKTNPKVRGLVNTYLPASMGGGSGDTKLYSVLGDDGPGNSLFMNDDMFLDDETSGSVSTDNTPLGALLDFDDDDAEGAIDILL